MLQTAYVADVLEKPDAIKLLGELDAGTALSCLMTGPSGSQDRHGSADVQWGHPESGFLLSTGRGVGILTQSPGGYLLSSLTTW